MSAFTNYAEDKIMDYLYNGGAALSITTMYVKLHLGAPGEDATANAAAETTRKAFTVAASSGGAVANEAAVEWTSYPAAETVTHFSVWDASTAGNPTMYGALSPTRAMQIGDTLRIPIGDLDLSVA